MTSFHMNSTGSQRSVGPRRVLKKYTFADGTEVLSKSTFGAKRQANKLGEIPTVSRAYSIFKLAIAGVGTDEATITVTGGFSPYTGAVSLQASTAEGGAINSPAAVSFTKETTTYGLATLIAAALDGASAVVGDGELAATASGNVVTVTEAGGANVTALTASLSVVSGSRG